MVAPRIEVFEHKFFVPAPVVGAIPRGTILERVQQPEVRVAMLQAPAGHGKTVTLQQIKAAFDAKGVQACWLTFDTADNDYIRFMTHMRALMATLGSIGDDDLAEAVPQSPARRCRTDWLINILAKTPQPVALFFDDVHVLEHSPILEFLREMLERLPGNVQVFMGSRSLPEIGLAGLLVTGNTLILRAADLRFSSAEVSDFLSLATNLEVNDAEINSIYHRTEGWPAAVRLFRIGMDSPTVRRSLGNIAAYHPRELAEYLTDSVLAMQSLKIRNFLLQTSLLGRLSAPLCNAVTGQKDAQEILLELERGGLFLRSLDDNLHWFDYHPLFSEITAAQLARQSPETVAKVHRRAMRWHLQQGNFEDAVYHAIECGDFAQAADTFNLWASRLIASGRLMTVERWYERLPFAEVAKRPALVIKVAWAMIFMRRPAKLKLLRELLLGWQGTGDVRLTTCPDIALSMASLLVNDIGGAFALSEPWQMQAHDVDGFPAFELGAVANMNAYRCLTLGQFEAAQGFLGLADAYSLRGDASFSGGYAVALTGVIPLLQGDLQASSERFSAWGEKQGDKYDESVAPAVTASCYVWVLYESNQLEMAEAVFSEHHDSIAESALPDFFAAGYLAMVRTLDASGQASKAEQLLEEVEGIGRMNNWPRVINLVKWERVRRALLQGDKDGAQAIAALVEPDTLPLPEGCIPVCEEIESEVLGRIRLAVHGLGTDNAAALLASEIDRSRKRVHRLIKLHLLEAIWHRTSGSYNATHRSLRRALQLAEAGRYIRIFLDEGDSVVQLLKEEYQTLMGAGSGPDSGVSQAYIAQLLRAAGAELPQPAVADTTDQPLIEPLTQRELDMLVLLANGVSNKAMARHMYVSENTVKFHLKNIYSKLAVTSRLQAITVAREHGLIP